MDTPGGDLRETGTALLRQGKFAEAAAALTDAVGENPNDGTLWSLLGAALSSNGDANKAVEAFQRAAALTPAAAKSQFNLGVALQATGQNSEAIQAFQKALTLDPGYEQAREKLNQLGGGPPAPSAGTTNIGGGNSTGLSSVGASYVPAPETGTTNLGGGDISGLSSVGQNYAPPPASEGGTTNLGGGNTSGLSGVGGNGDGAPSLRPPYTPPPAAPYGGQPGAPPPYNPQAQPGQPGMPPNPYGQNNYAPQPQLGMNYAAGGQVAPDLKGQQLLWTAILGFVCFGFVLGPVAWINANKALATLDQYPNDGGQRGTINAARIIGIIVTCLSVLGIVGRIVLLATNSGK